MKKPLCLFLIFLGICAQSISQTTNAPSSSWAEEVAIHPQNDEAWLYLFEEERSDLEKAKEKELGTIEQSMLKSVEEDISAAVPEGGAAHYAKFILSNYSDENAIESALAAYPENLLVREQVVNRAMIGNEASKIKEHLQKSFDLGAFNAAELEYAENVLRSVAPSGLLILNAEEDAHPIWYLQQVRSMRKDVKAVLLDLLVNEDYALQTAQTLSIDPKKIVGKPRSVQVENLLKQSALPSHLALTNSKNSIELMGKNLFVVGLCFRFSEEKDFQNLSLLEGHVNRFSLKQLSNNAAINRNYLFPLITLRNYLKNSGNSSYQNLDIQIQSLAQQFGLTQLVNQNLD